MRLPYAVISSDCHVIEPPDLWTKRMDAKWRHLAPRIESLEDTDIWVVGEDTRLAVVGIQDQAGFRFEENARITKKSRMEDLPRGAGGWVPELYLSGLDEDGVYGGVIYPSTAVQAYRCIDGQLLTELSKTYNDWMIQEFCGEAPHRLKAVAMMNVDDPKDAIAEMYRTAKLGAAAIMLPIFPAHPKTYDLPEYADMWAAAADIGLPIVFHLGTNQKAKHKEPPLDLIVHATKDIHVQRSIAILILGGIFAKHPNLRVGAVEFGASWAAPMLDRLDALYRRHKEKLPALPEGELPSDHFRRNVFLSFQDDVACIQVRKSLGVENLQWGNDFPHAESTYPRSRDFLQEHLGGLLQGELAEVLLQEHLGELPLEEAAAIASGNTAKMYGFDLVEAERHLSSLPASA